MAFTGSPVNATIYQNQVDGDGTKNVTADVTGKMRIARFSYTHAAGAGVGEINLVKLPPGKTRVLTDLCRLVTTQFASNADLHIGHRAYTNLAGTAVAEDDDVFGANIDAGGGAIDAAFTLPAGGIKEFDSRGEVGIYAMVDTGNIEDDDTINGYIVYTKD